MTDSEITDLLETQGCPHHVIEHCKSVAALARATAQRIPGCDPDTAWSGGLIHDLGRCITHGITHAVEGVRIAEEHGVEDCLIGIIRTHIGAGITKEEAAELGLPAEDYIPETLEEKAVAQADNLLSGTERRSFRTLMKKLEKRGLSSEARQRFIDLHTELSELAGTDLDCIEVC